MLVYCFICYFALYYGIVVVCYLGGLLLIALRFNFVLFRSLLLGLVVDLIGKGVLL